MRGWLLLAFGIAGCATAMTPGVGNDEVDAGVAEVDAAVTLDAPAPPIDGSIEPPPPPPPMDVTLSQSTVPTIASGNTIVCGNLFTGETHDNSFYRVFPLADHGITGPFTVKSVQFAVEAAESGSGSSQNVIVNVGTYTGTIAANTASLQGGQWFPAVSSTVSVPDGGMMMMTATLSTVIPAGSQLMVEVRSPGDGNRFFPGSNGSGETYPTFWRSDCDGAIKSYNTHGENVDLVLTVTGTK